MGNLAQSTALVIAFVAAPAWSQDMDLSGLNRECNAALKEPFTGCTSLKFNGGVSRLKKSILEACSSANAYVQSQVRAVRDAQQAEATTAGNEVQHAQATEKSKVAIDSATRAHDSYQTVLDKTHGISAAIAALRDQTKIVLVDLRRNYNSKDEDAAASCLASLSRSDFVAKDIKAFGDRERAKGALSIKK